MPKYNISIYGKTKPKVNQGILYGSLAMKQYRQVSDA